MTTVTVSKTKNSSYRESRTSKIVQSRVEVGPAFQVFAYGKNANPAADAQIWKVCRLAVLQKEGLTKAEAIKLAVKMASAS